MLTGTLTDGVLKSTELSKKDLKKIKHLLMSEIIFLSDCFQHRHCKQNSVQQFSATLKNNTILEIHPGFMPITMVFNPKQVPGLLRSDAEH